MTALATTPPLARPAGGAAQSLLVFSAAVGVALLIGAVAELFGPALAVAAPLALAVLALALRDYRLASWLAVFMLPIAPTYLFPRDAVGVSGVAVMYLLLAVAVTALFLAHALRPRWFAFPAWPRQFWMYLAVFALATLHGSLSVSSTPEYFVAMELVVSNSPGSYVWTSFLTPCLTLATAMIVSIAVRNARRPGLYLIPIICSAVVFAIAVFYYAASSGSSLGDLASQESRRYLSVTGLHANELGLLLNMGGTLAAFCCLYATRPLVRLALAIAAALLAAAVMLTFSRGAYLGALAVFAYLLLVQRKFMLFALALLVLPLAALMMPESVTQRATHEVGSKDVDAISSGRVAEIWEPLLPEIARRPLVGAGLGSIIWSDAAKQKKILPVTHPHSAYLGALLDLGVLGTAIVFLFFWHMWRLFTRLGRSAHEPVWRGFFRGGAACILLLLVQGLTDDSFMPSRTTPLLWLAYGAAIGFSARQQALLRAARLAPPESAASPPELPAAPAVKAELT